MDFEIDDEEIIKEMEEFIKILEQSESVEGWMAIKDIPLI